MSANKPAEEVKKVEVPRDQGKVAQAASPVATLSSHADPYPFYIASAVCGGASGWLYQSVPRDPRAALAAAGFALSYLAAGRMVTGGSARTGYDLGTATSVGLLTWMGPALGKNAVSTALATVGGLSTVANGIKSYELRTGKPKEMVEK